MASLAATWPLQKEWFRFEGNPNLPYMIPKAEYRDLIEQAYAAKRDEAVAERDRFLERVKEQGGGVQLTEEQKQELKSSYDPKNMSWAEYQDFVDKLCEFGVLEQEDKKFLHCGYGGGLEMTYIDWSAPLCVGRIEPVSGAHGSSFSDWKGNALGWAKYLSGFQGWDERSGSWQKTRESLLFERVWELLGEISK